MLQVPALAKVSVPPDVIVQTFVVDEVNVGTKVEVVVAVSVGVVPSVCAPGFANVIVWLALGVTAFDAADAGPAPAALVAVTLKVYAVPLVKPLTVIAHAAGPLQVPAMPPGDEVAA